MRAEEGAMGPSACQFAFAAAQRYVRNRMRSSLDVLAMSISGCPKATLAV
jgi:sulfite reductase beta subunit-like hemoprotein